MDIGIVCGYGLVVDSRLQSYLRSVLDYASQHALDALILSGGHTLKDARDTEARVMWRVMQPDIARFHMFLEERSISTLHNLLYSEQLLRREAISVETLCIFCDTLRFFKVFCLSKLIFRRYHVRIVSFERKEPLLMYALQIPFTLLQCLGAVCPPVEKGILTFRSVFRKSL